METPRFGFRLDPMAWIDSAGTVQAAQVRTVLLGRHLPGDTELLRQEIDGILATQDGSGALGDNTAGRLIRLERLGCAPDHPVVQRAATAMCRDDRNDDGLLGPYEIQAAVWSGHDDADLLSRSVQALAEQVMELDFWCACPWTGEVHLQGLWSGRQRADVAAALERGLRVMGDALGAGTGYPLYLDPWGFLDCVGRIDLPQATRVVRQQVPLILRGQHDDGTWGGLDHLGFGPADRTFLVMRALVNHDLLDTLRALPPLPRDWQVGPAVAVPPGEYGALTWDGDRFWLLERAAGRAVAVSASDGSVEGHVDLPDGTTGLGWTGAALAAVRAEPNALYLIDATTGEVREEMALEFWGNAQGVARVNGRLAVGNLHCGGVHLVEDGGRVTPHPHMLAGSWVSDLAGDGNTIWHLDGFSPAIVHSGLDEHNQLLDWGDRPFDQHTGGIAFDGTDLWVLDNASDRICAVRRRAAGGR